jgi:pyruvate-formate lyase-activating enzyme
VSRVLSAASGLLRKMRRVQRSLGAMIEHKIFVPSIEFFLADTCNLRCNNCAPSSPFMSEANLPSLESFIESLSFLSRVVRCDELRLLGGEPLLNKDICSFIRAAKESGIFRSVLVVTNGLLLPRMSEEFWQLTDSVRISVYPATTGTFSEATLESLRATASRSGTRLEVVRTTHFMEAIRDTRIEDASVVKRTFSNCAEAHGWSCHLLYRNLLYRCSRVHTLDRYLGKIGVEHENFTDQDGIVIDGRSSLFADLKNYMKSSRPLKACSFCLGTSGALVEHRQLTVQQIRSKMSGPVREFASRKSIEVSERVRRERTID